jgi:hypothetical protein
MFLDQQKYMECQLVTAINAAIYLGEPGIDQNSPEYERLVDLVKARCGSAISNEKAIEYLRLDSELISPKFDVLRKTLDEGYPVEIGVFTEKHGNHSVLVVDYAEGKEEYSYQVLNLKPYTKSDCYISGSDLLEILNLSKNITPLRGKFRKFFMHKFYAEESFRRQYKSFGLLSKRPRKYVDYSKGATNEQL